MPKLKIDNNGNRKWLNSKDQLHRLDGPAVEEDNGSKAWYLKGIEYTEEQYYAKIKNR